MPFLSTPLTLAATGGILGSAWISGNITALSICAVPAVLQSGTTAEGLLRGWHLQFTRGMYYLPTTAAAIALNYCYLASRHHGRGLEWRGYAAGALSNLLLIPFTVIFLGGINGKMIAAYSGTGKQLSQETVRHLIALWGKLNGVRIFMPLAGAALGLWNLLQ
ncbi:hypothetical protein F5Y00DRAFT_200920 [Daldinia vernicosa]|uniref:uncharacterized protein n=1 Tax=Daldinia vernicosa TaxID=114800 RepID=UPI002007F612|nr:uncharacterized protein F5Y00DRAFT_200920 [Daldinia vernicosa]KAI0844383.1 hypothetical protein F5Y00DRAFT_200920 [Daldinia vernicosa]